MYWNKNQKLDNIYISLRGPQSEANQKFIFEVLFVQEGRRKENWESGLDKQFGILSLSK